MNFKHSVSVQDLQNIMFSQLSLPKQNYIKVEGHSVPNFKITQAFTRRKNPYLKNINREVYSKHDCVNMILKMDYFVFCAYLMVEIMDGLKLE